MHSSAKSFASSVIPQSFHDRSHSVIGGQSTHRCTSFPSLSNSMR